MTGALTECALEQAFRRFEKAASTLEEHHSDLQAKVTRLERRLLDANRRLETVLDALSIGVAVVSSDGGLLRTNRAFERMRRDWKNEPLSRTALTELLESGPSAGGSARLRVEAAEGARDLAATLIPVGDEEKTHVLTLQDITSIRREEEEGGRRRRLEALGRMAAELAHEVRNPVGSIRLFASMLHEDLDGQDEARSMAEQILAASAGLETTVSNLLTFASPARGERRDLDLAELAREACALLAPACAIRGLRLKGPEAGATCPVSADPEGMRQVLLNLLGNALAATESGGAITISTAREETRVRLTVRDDGNGIAAEDLPRVFDPFFTRTEGGSGLGLSIVHGILERHGGRITLDSQAGKGTCARVELPVGAVAEGRHGAQHA